MALGELNHEHQKITIDNMVCKRRFHLIYEENHPNPEHVVIKCPHCSEVIFEDKSHAPVLLAREENLVKSPTGEFPIMKTCSFQK